MFGLGIKYLGNVMFALLCKPVAVPVPNVGPVLRTNDCRIAYVRPSKTDDGKLEVELLYAPPIKVNE